MLESSHRCATSAPRGLARRDLLKHGAIGIGGATLANVLRMQAASATSGSPPPKARSVIMVCLPGGPSHIDMYDLKPGAPVDYRGEFDPIRTNVPGFDISERFPLQARIADKLSLVRTVQFVEPMQHELEEVYSGYPKFARRPAFGSIISRFKGADASLPSYVSLEYSNGITPYEGPQYAGSAHAALNVAGTDGVRNLSLPYGLTLSRLGERRELLQSVDRYRRDVDAARRAAESGQDGKPLDPFAERALDMITSSAARDAFDLEREPTEVRERYGRRDDKFSYVSSELDSIWDSQKFLLARRLVEAGVPVVKLRMGGWDQHGNVIQASGGKNIWFNLRTELALLDRSIHALVTDLAERGLDREVVVLVWGEFGRTPRIHLGGRDHWPEVGFALFAGAVRTGQVVGETDWRAERPATRSVSAQNVLGTLYHALGIDYRQSLNDFAGRPTPLLDDGEPIAELV